MHKAFNYFFFILCLSYTTAQSQIVPRHFKDSISHATLVKLGYVKLFPLFDLSNRFGDFHAISGEGTYKTNKNWLWGGKFDFMFGSNVKENDMLRNITIGGFVIGADGLLIDPSYSLRGFNASVHTGKIIPIGYNNNSGISLLTGAGLLQHKVFISLERNTQSYAFTKEQAKGYDRLSNGFFLSQSIGYTHLSNRGLINFFGSLDFGLAFTQNRRSFNYDSNTTDTQKRTDGFWGIRIGFILPIYPRTTPEFYYN